ncbi:hypothetical protein [Frigoriglobus tundricola]|uniref:HEAT repeat domain-containing protein n=1 Tax=Frigoriglobus tundricola TaxID=2774151 RepID=A0A6M5Z4C6_9BACT|nr:hypothetical protein [Frigoriglobus tundricola]QJX00351.1 hypothetical protein FTUN_7979 [Frigoriglobus tundricola]
MPRTRFITWTLLAVGGFALLPAAASGQAPLPKKPDTARIIELRELPRGGIQKAELKEAREHFAKLAKYYADTIAHPDVWKASQDFKIETPGALRPPTIDGPEGLLRDLDRYLLEFVPGTKTPNLEPLDYIREFGAALDAALKNLIETHPEPIVQINAARVLAHVARTGAPAHYTTITALLSNANTPTGVRNYLFHAAGAVLSAYDPNDPVLRKHSGDPAAVGALIKVLDDAITTPSMLLTGLPADAKVDDIAQDQLLVIGYVRRQAVKALAQCKFASFPGPGGKTIYPAFTLTRVARGDSALAPLPGPAEAAEAIIGICGMAPVFEQNKGGFAAVKGYNPDVAVEAILAGLITFAKPRAGDAFNRSLPWRTYALRIAGGMRDWRPLFDPDFNPNQPNRFAPQLVPASVEELLKEVVPKVLAPMDKVDANGKPDIAAKVDIEGLQRRLVELRARPNRKTELFTGVPQTRIDFAELKK